jgi:two-component system, NarL family, nitrate/nitrite response regulator NarL
MDKTTINIVVVDDHPMVLEGMKAMLSEISFVRLLGLCKNAFEAMELMRKQLPDVLITDINMPEVNGIALTQKLTKEYPSVKVLAMSTYKERSYVGQMIQHGASGYVLKSASKEEIEAAILDVYEGKMYVSDDIGWSAKEQNDLAKIPALSSREKEILSLIAEGLPNPRIAEKLFLSLHTVDTHRKNLLTKFGVSNTASLIHIASKNNII